MKKILAIAFMAVLMTPLSAHAFDWGGLFRWLLFGSESTTVSKSVSDYSSVAADVRKQSKSTDELLEKALVSIISDISVQKDAKTFEDRITALSKGNKTESEINTQLVQIVNDYASNLQNNKLALILTIKTMSDKEKKNLASNIKSLSEYADKYTELAKTGTTSYNNLLKYTTASDEQTKVVNEITTVTNEIKTKASAVQALATTLKLFAKLSGLEM